MIANSDSQRLLNKVEIFAHTMNTPVDYFYQFRDLIEINKKTKKPIFDGIPLTAK
jgi:hypothetical protein